MEKTCGTRPRPKTFREFIKSSYFLRPLLGILIGGTGGFLYYYFVGCASGTCAITSSPYMSTLFGSFFGFFLVNRPCGKC